MLSRFAPIDTIIIFLRLFLKSLGIYVLINLDIPSTVMATAIIVLALSELYEFPLMFLAHHSRRNRTYIFTLLGIINISMVLGILYFTNELSGDLYLFAVATAIGVSIGGGLVAGATTGLFAAVAYLYLLSFSAGAPMLSASIRSVFILFIGSITGLISEIVYHTEAEMTRILEDKTQYNKVQLIKQKFITTASHHLRTPLTVIKGYAEIAADADADPQERIQATERILIKIDELEDLTEQLVHLASIQSITEHLKLRTIILTQFLEEVYDQHLEEAKSRGIRFKYNSDESIESLRIEIDTEQIAIALSNLLTNAFKFTPKGGTVVLSASSGENSVYITVTDTGKGIPQKDVEHLFTMFYQAGSFLSPKDGTGIGLFTTQEIIKAHSGTIKVKSRLGKGTTFVISLPKNSMHQLIADL
ncbi:HAMP domain-containing histidine kinase [candidate division WWE3 bacterium]|uniref:histidine kinase n=1 Tax=candidate division WWE3 bacterium TaxID=2053526 RepID=A0A955LGJ6_UNCKA|nr:HAMP domain-containing histidine kinase [candidate division WWE3 bacterium]